MRAGQIDKFYRRVIDLEESNVSLDGNARVIANALLETRQTVE